MLSDKLNKFNENSMWQHNKFLPPSPKSTHLKKWKKAYKSL